MKKEVVLTYRIPEDQSALNIQENAELYLAALESFQDFLFSGIEHKLTDIQAKFTELTSPLFE